MNHQFYDQACLPTPRKHKDDLICAEGFSVCVFMEQSFDTTVYLMLLLKNSPNALEVRTKLPSLVKETKCVQQAGNM